MSDVETLKERVQSVERAVTDGDHGFPAIDDVSDLIERIETVEQRVEEIDERTEELEAATQALRGYVGNVRSVNERVEKRADAALAATDRLEERLDERDQRATSSVAEHERTPTDRRGVDTSAMNPNTPADSERTRPPETSPTSVADSARPTGTDGARRVQDRQAQRERTSSDDAPEEDRDLGMLERIRSLL